MKNDNYSMKLNCKKVAALAATLITFGSLAGGANGAVLISFSDEAGGTRVDIAGSIDTAGLSLSGDFGTSVLAMKVGTEFWFGEGIGNYSFSPHGQEVLPWHSLSQSIVPISDASGNDFGINNTNIALPSGYVSGTRIASSFVIDGLTLADIDPQSGTVLTLGNGDTVSVSIIPEPSSTLLVGIGALGVVTRRRRTN